VGGCVFCSIVKGELPASVVHSDDEVMVLMDIQPVNPGHMLVIPKAHAAHLADLDPQTGAKMFVVAMQVAECLRRSGVRCEGVNLMLADGEAAFQDVFHVHLHVIPRFKGDGFGFTFNEEYHKLPERKDLEEVASKIRDAMDGLNDI
jgi:histidine triad (HIT) family protein